MAYEHIEALERHNDVVFVQKCLLELISQVHYKPLVHSNIAIDNIEGFESCI